MYIWNLLAFFKDIFPQHINPSDRQATLITCCSIIKLIQGWKPKNKSLKINWTHINKEKLQKIQQNQKSPSILNSEGGNCRQALTNNLCTVLKHYYTYDSGVKSCKQTIHCYSWIALKWSRAKDKIFRVSM